MLSRKTIQRKTAATERRIAAQLGGRRVSGSGSGTEKGDARVEPTITENADGSREMTGLRLRIESKRVFTKSEYSVTSSVLLKIVQTAVGSGSYPVLHVQCPDFEWAVIQHLFWLQLVPVQMGIWPLRTLVRSVKLRALDWIPRDSTAQVRRYTFALGARAKEWDAVVIPWSEFVRLVGTKEVS